MAVDASNLKFFPSQHIQERDLMLNPCVPANVGSLYNDLAFSGIPFAATLPVNQSCFQQTVCDSVQPKTSMNADSGLTYNIPAPRKRSRDCISQMYALTQNFPPAQKTETASQFSCFVGDDFLPQIRQYQMDIDAIVSQHSKRIRLELEERQKQHARSLVAAIGETVAKKLKEKEDQIQKMSKLNYALQERVKSLYVENQLWREMAQTNEATANSLRGDLEQVLAHVSGEERMSAGAAAEEDVASCCGSCDQRDDEEAAAVEEEVNNSENRKCKNCGERECCVLLLPCRHLCLCNVCGSGSHQLKACPVCNACMNATLHVNMSA